MKRIAILGGGMFSFFTELNRKRPPAHLLDFVTHTTSSIVHAADDLSVMETLETPPYIAASVKAFIGKAKYRVGPSCIGARDNPYGAAAAPNPDNGRVCLARSDPRQRGLFGAAFTLGYAAAFARSGLEVLTLGAAAGPLGSIHLAQAQTAPWYDESGARLYPMFHVVRSLANAEGAAVLTCENSDPGKIAVLACRKAGGQGSFLWIANLTGARQSVRLEKPLFGASIVTLDEKNFAAATREPDYLNAAAKPRAKLEGFALAAYAVAMISA